MSSTSQAPVLRLPPDQHHDYKRHIPQESHGRNSLPPPPTLQIKSTTFLGPVKSQTTSVARDLGFPGRLGEYVLLTYGDTLFTKPKTSAGNKSDAHAAAETDTISNSNSDCTWHGMVCNSVALATEDATWVHDVRGPGTCDSTDGSWWPGCFLKPADDEDESEWALGLTGVLELSPGCGEFLSFLLLYVCTSLFSSSNSSSSNKNSNTHLVDMQRNPS